MSTGLGLCRLPPLQSRDLSVRYDAGHRHLPVITLSNAPRRGFLRARAPPVTDSPVYTVQARGAGAEAFRPLPALTPAGGFMLKGASRLRTYRKIRSQGAGADWGRFARCI